MAGRVGALTIVRAQVSQYAATVRSLGPWLIIAIPLWLIVGRRAYAEEQERIRRLRIAAVVKRDKQR